MQNIAILNVKCSNLQSQHVCIVYMFGLEICQLLKSVCGTLLENWFWNYWFDFVLAGFLVMQTFMWLWVVLVSPGFAWSCVLLGVDSFISIYLLPGPGFVWFCMVWPDAGLIWFCLVLICRAGFVCGGSVGVIVGAGVGVGKVDFLFNGGWIPLQV